MIKATIVTFIIILTTVLPIILTCFITFKITKKKKNIGLIIIIFFILLALSSIIFDYNQQFIQLVYLLIPFNFVSFIMAGKKYHKQCFKG